MKILCALLIFLFIKPIGIANNNPGPINNLVVADSANKEVISVPANKEVISVPDNKGVISVPDNKEFVAVSDRKLAIAVSIKNGVTNISANKVVSISSINGVIYVWDNKEIFSISTKNGVTDISVNKIIIANWVALNNGVTEPAKKEVVASWVTLNNGYIPGGVPLDMAKIPKDHNQFKVPFDSFFYEYKILATTYTWNVSVAYGLSPNGIFEVRFDEEINDNIPDPPPTDFYISECRYRLELIILKGKIKNYIPYCNQISFTKHFNSGAEFRYTAPNSVLQEIIEKSL